MAQPFQVALPPNRYLSDGDVITITAIDPTTGNTVSGVKVNNVILELELLSGAASALSSGPFLYVPGPDA